MGFLSNLRYHGSVIIILRAEEVSHLENVYSQNQTQDILTLLLRRINQPWPDWDCCNSCWMDYMFCFYITLYLYVMWQYRWGTSILDATCFVYCIIDKSKKTRETNIASLIKACTEYKNSRRRLFYEANWKRHLIRMWFVCKTKSCHMSLQLNIKSSTVTTSLCPGRSLIGRPPVPPSPLSTEQISMVWNGGHLKSDLNETSALGRQSHFHLSPVVPPAQLLVQRNVGLLSESAGMFIIKQSAQPVCVKHNDVSLFQMTLNIHSDCV